MGIIQRFREWLSPRPVAPEPQTIRYVPPELFAEIHRLKERADWMGKLVEDEERAFTYGDDGTIQFGMSQSQPGAEMFGYAWAYAQSLFRPSYGACFCINEAQHRIIRARSRAFTSINPYWHGVQHNLKTHTVGTGHKWTAVARNPADKPDQKKLTKVQKELDDFYAGTGTYAGQGSYRELQGEKCDRKSRDGEYFLQYMEEGVAKERRVRVRFVEPLTVWTPQSMTENDDVWFGVRFLKGDYEKPLGYYIRRTTYLGADRSESYGAWDRMVPADIIQHRKVNVDKSTVRGIPDTYWVQARFEQSVRTLKAMGMLVQVRAKIALIRTHINALAGSVQPMLSANAAATVAGPGGQLRNVQQFADGSILDVNDASQYQFPGQNIETDKIVASIQADLQACATSTGLADYMVSGSLGGASYASSMVAEGPVVKTFEELQQNMIDEDREVVNRVLQTAVEAGRLDEDTLEVVKVEMSGPPLAGRDAIQVAQAHHIYLQDGVESLTTVQQELGLDPKVETANKEANKTTMAVAAEQAATAAADKAASDGMQARNKQGSTARPFSPSQEGRQKQRASGATREEETRMLETAHDAYSQDLPTQAELAMSEVLLTPAWLINTKKEILELLRIPAPANPSAVATEYEPGVKGYPLGVVDGQTVYAVDMRAMEIKYRCPGLIVAGNHMAWDFIAPDKIVVDWSFTAADRAADLIHEIGEARLMDIGRWPYAMAHRTINAYETAFLLELRPELAPLAPKE
jgi:capsid protein